MKLKGLTKLVLAGTALAATAATLTTSTYAWYVTNNKVEATGVSGATAGSSVAGSLLISENDTATTTPVNYTTSIDLTSAVAGAAALNPQTKAATGTVESATKYFYKTKDKTYNSEHTYYTNVSGTTYTAANITAFAENTVYYEASDSPVWVDKEGKKIDTPTMVTFSFWLKASSDMTGVSVYTKFANSANAAVAAAKRQTFYAGTGLPSGKVKGDTFAVDAVYALRMEVTQEEYIVATDPTYIQTSDEDVQTGKTYYTESAGEYTAVANPAKADIATYYEKKLGVTRTGTAAVVKNSGVVEQHDACYTDAADKYKSPTYTDESVVKNVFDSHTGGDANVYYKTVMQTAGFGTDSSDGTSANLANTTWTSLNLTANKDNLITISIWLEGTDAQCWDSCIGQTFTLQLKFEKVQNS